MPLEPSSRCPIATILLRCVLPCLCLLLVACETESSPSPSPAHAGGVDFDQVASDALEAMKQHAGAINANGAAIVAYIPGEATRSWASRMLVVGSFSKNNTNVLGIVYTKAAEMADTLKDSGSGVRPSLKGENGYKGGVIQQVPGGYVLAAFSGAKSEDDVSFSRAGLEILAKAYGALPAGK